MSFVNFSFADRFTPDAAMKLVAVASKHGIQPSELSECIGFETGFTFDPAIQNKSTKATGLIQFMPETCNMLGVTVEQMKKKTQAQQLEYVDKYMQARKAQYGALNTIDRLYFSIFYPVAINKPNSYVFNTSVYNVNKVFDTTKKGYFTRGDVVSVLSDTIRKAKGLPPVKKSNVVNKVGMVKTAVTNLLKKLK